MKFVTIIVIVLYLSSLIEGRMRRCRRTCLCSNKYVTIVCADSGLTGLPSLSLFGIEVTVRTEALGLQRNNISNLDTKLIERRFPKLVFLDIREQAATPVVKLEGGKLPPQVQVDGEQPLLILFFLFQYFTMFQCFIIKLPLLSHCR